MKLLSDEQLSLTLVRRLAHLYPDSSLVHERELGSAADRTIWDHAPEHQFTIVTKDADFVDFAISLKSPPKVVWIRLGNCTTQQVEHVSQSNVDVLHEFAKDDASSILALGGNGAANARPA